MNVRTSHSVSPWLALGLWALVGGFVQARTLSDPAVDAYNVRVGTQTFAGLYQFTTNTLLVETAQAIRELGSDVIKYYHGRDFTGQYRIPLASNITNLLTLARDEPSCRHVLDMPFRHVVMWTYPFGNSWPFDGYSASERAVDYRENFDLSCYLLTNYTGSGKSFYLGHWEGDWYLLPNYNTSTNPNPVAIQGMIDWLNTRQQAIDDAKRSVSFHDVNVFGYAEVNRVLDATSGDSRINRRMINTVIPYVTNLDFLSYSSYDVMDASASTLVSTLDYMASILPTNKAGVLTGPRLWIGEYGWGGVDSVTQEQKCRAYWQRLLSWKPGPKFILYWEIYNNETNRTFWLVDSNHVKVAAYDLHQRFLNIARLQVARFQERTGRLPSEVEFGPLLTPLLNGPLPPQVNLGVTNLSARSLTSSNVAVSGTLLQGQYGDESACVWVFWGRQDGDQLPSAWEQSQWLGVNTNFNPATFSATLTNLAPQADYYFRFCASNGTGRVWAPSSSRFNTDILNAPDYGSRMKVTFAGYTGSDSLRNFPALVTLTTNLPGFSYRQFASPTGGDLRFTTGDELTLLPYEIDEWNTNGSSYVWVHLPELSVTNNSIWAFWGNPLDPTPLNGSTNRTVWSPDHLLVWHLRESTFPYLDSAGAHPGMAGKAPSSVPGRVGGAGQFDGRSQFLNAGAVNLGNSFTLSAWVNLAPTASDIQTLWANKAGGYNAPGFALYVNSYQSTDGKLLLETGNGTAGLTASTGPGAITTGQWHRIVATVDVNGGAAQLYVDGHNLTQNDAIRADLAVSRDLNLGRFTNGVFFWRGSIDEARIESGVRSADWILADWLTSAANSLFSTYSTVTPLPPLLSAVASGARLSLTWPASGVDWVLCTATNLAPYASWAPVSTPAVFLANQWQVVLSTSSEAARFFRLQLP